MHTCTHAYKKDTFSTSAEIRDKIALYGGFCFAWNDDIFASSRIAWSRYYGNEGNLSEVNNRGCSNIARKKLVSCARIESNRRIETPTNLSKRHTHTHTQRFWIPYWLFPLPMLLVPFDWGVAFCSNQNNVSILLALSASFLYSLPVVNDVPMYVLLCAVRTFLCSC